MGAKRAKRLRKVNRRKHRVSKNLTPEIRAKLATMPTLPDGRPNPLYRPIPMNTPQFSGDGPLMMRLQQAQLRGGEVASTAQMLKSSIADKEADNKRMEQELKALEGEHKRQEMEQKILAEKLKTQNAIDQKEKEYDDLAHAQKLTYLKDQLKLKNEEVAQVEKAIQQRKNEYDMERVVKMLDETQKSIINFQTQYKNLPTQGATTETINQLNRFNETLMDVSKLLGRGKTAIDDSVLQAIRKSANKIYDDAISPIEMAKNYAQERIEEVNNLTDGEWKDYKKDQLELLNARLRAFDTMGEALYAMNYNGGFYDKGNIMTYEDGFEALKKTVQDTDDYIFKASNTLYNKLIYGS